MLLDADYMPRRKLYLFNTAISLLIAAGYFIQPPPPSAKLYLRALPFLFLTLAAFTLICAFTRLQIREGGIWGYWSLLLWHKITGYSWLDEANLLVQTNGRSIFRSGGFVVPHEHRAAFSSYLEQRTT